MVAALVAEPLYDSHADEAEALDARLVELERSAAPVRRALARLAGAMVRTRAWEALGFVRLADYARERAGLSGRELHDLAHVDAALDALPAIEVALAAGRLGWTKARLLCRVATGADEAHWLALAGQLSAAALAREVRRIDRGALEAGPEPGEEEPDQREVLHVRAPRHVLAKWGHVKRTLRQVAGEWLPAETCAELVAAEVLSAIRLGPAEAERLPAARACAASIAPEEGAREPRVPTAAGAPPSPFVLALTEGLSQATPRELDRRLRRAAALERTCLARIGPLLLAFADARGPQALGFRSLDAYARERLGMSPRAARALLRVERACAHSASFAAAWRSGRITISQARALVPLVLASSSGRFHAAWLARAPGVTVRRLEDDVDHALASGSFDPAELPALPTGVQIGARPTRCETNEAWRVNVPADVGRLFRACVCSVARRLDGSPSTALEAMFDHCIATWRPRPAGRQPAEHRIFERDGWRCTVPGCTSYRNLHAHHVVFRSAGGGDEASNLTTLCAAHHQRGVHAGVIRITGRAPEALMFELPLGRFRFGDRCVTLPPP